MLANYLQIFNSKLNTMKTSISITLDKRRKKKDGTFPIVLLLVHFSKTTTIHTGYSVLEKDWDDEKRCIKKSFKGIESVPRLNNLIDKQKSEAVDVITKLHDKKELFKYSVRELKMIILPKEFSKITLFIYLEKYIQSMIELNKIGNARVYKTLLTSLKKMLRNKDVLLSEINYDFIKRFEIDYLSRGNSVNGLAVYLKTLRALFNKAIKEKLLEKENYPFDGYTIKTIETSKRSISIDAIKRIIELKLEKHDPLYQARNFFLASFYLMGISFIDLAMLKIENIIDGRIKYIRRKTHKPYDVKISENLSLILDVYINGKKKHEYIFPIIKSDSIQDQYRDVILCRNEYNKSLQKLAIECNIDEHLTSYVSRHSFATILKYNNVPITAISEMLGHSTIKTTQVYLNTLPSDVLDNYNEIITKI